MTQLHNDIHTNQPHPATAGDSTPSRRLPVWRTTALAVGAAVLTWAAEAPLGGVDLTVSSGGATRDVGVVSVVVSAVIVALAAAGTARLVRRWATRPRRTWLVTGTMVLVLSFAGPIGQAVTTSAGLALAALHVVVGLAVVPTLAAALPQRREA